MRTTILLTALLVLLGAAPASASSDASAFLAKYVRPDGRVVRLDQGGDTVSAGQAQAMLIAVALHDSGEFERIWGWTRKHLQLANHLLASRWKNGRVVNPQPASDADLDAARALLLAGFRKAALQIAGAVLADETIVRGGADVLVAGPWARSAGIIDPGYWAPRTLELFAAATHDARYTRLETGELRLAAALTRRAPHLPPDWAAVSANGTTQPIRAPRGHQPAPPQFSLEAARLPIRFAEACGARARTIAADAWPFFARQDPSKIGSAYALDGAERNRNQAAIMLVAAAGAAQADGKPAQRDGLLADADSINARFPTYYGAAWIALGRIELTTHVLRSC